MTMEIVLAGDHAFTPGQEIAGHLGWHLPHAPRWLELRLFWYTEGKGTQDVGVIARERLAAPAASGTQPFRFTAPAQPPSCSGRLVSIRWALELVGDEHQPVSRVELVIAPGGREILLGSVP